MQAIIGALVFLAVLLPVTPQAQSQQTTISCEKCDSPQGNCNSGTCDGVWCTAVITENRVTKTRSVRKDCASVNPSGKQDDGCVKDTQNDGAEVYRCGCKREANCNSESGIARMQAMLNNQFSLPGAAGAGAGSGAGPNANPGASVPFPGAPPPQPGSGGQPPNGQLPQVPPGLVNPNSTFTDVISAQPTPFPGANPNQPLPGQPGQNGQPQSGPVLGPNSGPQPLPLPTNTNGGSPQSPQFPQPNGNQFPQGGPNNVPPVSPNQNKPLGPRTGPETEIGNAPFPGGSPANPNVIDHGALNGNDSNPILINNRPPPPTNDLSGNPAGPSDGGRSRSGSLNVKNGMRTCACTEPSCNGQSCKGEVCYQMMFSANDVHNQAFSGKQGQVVHSGCTDDASVLASGSHNAHRQVSDYKFKINGQEIMVPASATYCNDSDYCNGAGSIYAKSMAVFVGVSLALALLIRF